MSLLMYQNETTQQQKKARKSYALSYQLWELQPVKRLKARHINAKYNKQSDTSRNKVSATQIF